VVLAAASAPGADEPVCRAAAAVFAYGSSMCSTDEGRLARLGQAIDDLAADSRTAAAERDHVADRVAGIWALLAEIDPELASRLAGYYAAPD
jgi:hypothetical protein